MEVKTQHKEYKSWLTELQWNKLGKAVVNKDDKDRVKELWANQLCQVSAVYISPDNVRDMTPEDEAEIRDKKAQHRKDLQICKERHISIERLRDERLQESYGSSKQWIDKMRYPLAEAKWRLGRCLNDELNTYVFNKDEWYCLIYDTEEFSSYDERDEYLKKHYIK